MHTLILTSDGGCLHFQATRVMMRIILCCMLASFASFLAALAAKRISTHFLKSTHFKKLHLALEKVENPVLPHRSFFPVPIPLGLIPTRCMPHATQEHYLKRLSNPKLRRKVEQTGHKGTKVLSVPNLRDVAKDLKVKPGMGRLSVDGNLTSIWNAKRPGRSRHRSYDDADPAYLGEWPRHSSLLPVYTPTRLHRVTQSLVGLLCRQYQGRQAAWRDVQGRLPRRPGQHFQTG
jgi:hypothetical protein